MAHAVRRDFYDDGASCTYPKWVYGKPFNCEADYPVMSDLKAALPTDGSCNFTLKHTIRIKNVALGLV